MEISLKEKRAISISPAVLSVFIVFMLCVVAFQNGTYLAVCLFTILLILKLIWRIHLPGILPFAFLMQWLQVVTYVVWMNVRNLRLELVSRNAPNAVFLSCIGLLIMALVVNLATRNLPANSMETFKKQAVVVNPKKILGLYLFSTFFLSSIGFVFGNTSGLAQILVTIASLKWIFFMWYGYIAWVNKKNRLILVIILIYEFSTGLYSYFSSFKEVLFYAILVSLSFIKHITFRKFITFLIIGGCLLAIFLTWTVIKGSYRQFLNQGSSQQVVSVSQSEALAKIGEKVSNISWEKYQLATSLALYRIQYIYHLTIVMDRIPALMPYESGHVWWQNVSFVLTPRILFPNKPIYEATVKTNKYTGFHYAGMQKGASFSLGYFADSYVDFGYLGMFIPLILIALFVAVIYRTFYNMNQLNLFFRFAIINVTLYNFTSFEADGLFLFGRLLTNFLVFWLLSKTLFPSIQKWLYKQ